MSEARLPDTSLEAFERLFAEVNALGIRLKQATGPESEASTLPVGGKSTLQVLHRHGTQTVPQIAGVRSTSRQNIQILVNRLAVEGCVELVPNPTHRRSPLVRLTPRGQALVEAADQRDQQWLANLAKEFPAAEVAAAATLLHRLRQRLAGEPKTAPRPAPKLPRDHTLAIPVATPVPAEPFVPSPALTQPVEVYELPVSLL